MSDLPVGWTRTTLGEFAVPSRVAVAPASYPHLPFLGLEDVEAGTTKILGTSPSASVRSTSYYFPAHSTLYARLRPYLNKVCSPAFEGMGSGEFITFLPTPHLAPGFLKYLLNQPKFVEFTATLDTGDRPRVNWGGICQFQCNLPPLPEQERIVATIDRWLSRLDVGVAALRRARQNLDRLEAGIRNALLADTDGRSWPMVRMASVLKRGRYGTSTKCSYEGDGLPVLRIPNVQLGRISMDDIKRAIDPAVDLSASVVEEGDVLIIRTNGSRSLIGRAAVVPAQNEPLAFASYLIQLKFDRGQVDPRYVVAALSAGAMRRRIESLAATTAGQYNINLDKLRSLEIPVPSLADQERQVADANVKISMIQRIDMTLSREEHRAQRLRSSILSAAFSGECVPQDQLDEPASALLGRIAAQRASFNGPRNIRPRSRRAKVTA